MKREEFMKIAEREIESAFRGQRNRMMNLVEQAWAEGKRNAEIDGISNIVNGVLENLGIKKEQTETMHKHICPHCKHEWWNNKEFEFTCPECDGDIS